LTDKLLNKHVIPKPFYYQTLEGSTIPNSSDVNPKADLKLNQY